MPADHVHQAARSGAYRQRAQQSAWEHAEDAIILLEAAREAIGEGDVPLAQDRLDEAYAAVIAARRATGPDRLG